jgi:hypothetical protein
MGVPIGGGRNGGLLKPISYRLAQVRTCMGSHLVRRHRSMGKTWASPVPLLISALRMLFTALLFRNGP